MASKGAIAAKILFYLSFIPIVCLIIQSIYNIRHGFGLYEPVSIYGKDAYYKTLFTYGLGMCLTGELPICLVYQVSYILWQTRSSLKNIHPKNFLTKMIIASVAIGVVTNIINVTMF